MFSSDLADGYKLVIMDCHSDSIAEFITDIFKLNGISIDSEVDGEKYFNILKGHCADIANGPDSEADDRFVIEDNIEIDGKVYYVQYVIEMELDNIFKLKIFRLIDFCIF